ncbi:hypothetical protein [Oceanobacillus sp. CAU 1775]
MNFFRFRFYLEVLAISVGIVLIIAILPIQIFIHRQIKVLTVFTGSILWYTIIFHNMTFQEIREKWFKR